jgi:enamine deaminase RidA (YjgF/YER057c/UK114 family)
MFNRTILAATLLAAVAAGPASAQEFEKKMFNYSKFAKGAFAEAATISGPAKMVYLAGIGSEDPDDGSVRHKDNFLEQCGFAWSKIKSALAANGATVSDIVKATTYVTDARYRTEMQDCRKETYGNVPPPHTFVNVVQLARPGMMIEVDVVAAVAAK